MQQKTIKIERNLTAILWEVKERTLAEIEESLQIKGIEILQTKTSTHYQNKGENKPDILSCFFNKFYIRTDKYIVTLKIYADTIVADSVQLEMYVENKLKYKVANVQTLQDAITTMLDKHVG